MKRSLYALTTGSESLSICTDSPISSELLQPQQSKRRKTEFDRIPDEDRYILIKKAIQELNGKYGIRMSGSGLTQGSEDFWRPFSLYDIIEIESAIYSVPFILKKTKRLNRNMSSYGIKHIVEKHPHYIELRGHKYCSNGALIVAMKVLGFKVGSKNEMNCYFAAKEIKTDKEKQSAQRLYEKTLFDYRTQCIQKEMKLLSKRITDCIRSYL